MRLRPAMMRLIDHDSCADPGTENDAEHHRCLARGTIDGFRERETVRVIFDAQRDARASTTKSRSSGRPLSTALLEFLMSPVRGEIAPGVPIPTDPRCPSLSSIAATKSRNRFAASRRNRPRASAPDGAKSRVHRRPARSPQSWSHPNRCLSACGPTHSPLDASSFTIAPVHERSRTSFDLHRALRALLPLVPRC